MFVSSCTTYFPFHWSFKVWQFHCFQNFKIFENQEHLFSEYLQKIKNKLHAFDVYKVYLSVPKGRNGCIAQGGGTEARSDTSEGSIGSYNSVQHRRTQCASKDLGSPAPIPFLPIGLRIILTVCFCALPRIFLSRHFVDWHIHLSRVFNTALSSL